MAAMAADEDNPAYKMDMASQRQHDLQLQWAQAPNNPPATHEESKAINEDAMKAGAAYARMTSEEKAMYKKGLTAQRQMDLQAHQDYRASRPRSATSRWATSGHQMTQVIR
jgi:hypothetical protein